MDVSIVLDYLQTFFPLERLNLRDITLKTTMLVTLLSGQRCQTVHALTLSGMTNFDDTVCFEITKLLKTSKPVKHQGRLEFKAYPIVVVTCLKHYDKIRKSVPAGHDALLSYSELFSLC